jgi:biotin carboxyl carrier protein
MLNAERHAEELYVPERLVIAPHPGVFHPFVLGVTSPTPELITVGQQIGAVLRMGDKYPVRSSFAGTLLGLLVLPGERVRRYQAVAWLRIADVSP